MKRWFLASLLCVAMLLGYSPQAFAVDMEKLDLGGMEVAYWVPMGASEKTPVIIFSHPFNGCVREGHFITRALANADYAVFAPIHRDSHCNKKRPDSGNMPVVPFARADLWSDHTYEDRKNDIKALLDQLPLDSRFKKLGWDKVGMAGHSLGGYTALAMAGGWASWKDARIKAVLALSPYGKPFLYYKTVGNISVPVMYQSGGKDWLHDDIIGSGSLYELTRTPKSYMELTNANHTAWSANGDTSLKYSISTYSIAFFDYYIKGKPLQAGLEKPSQFVGTVYVDKMASAQPQPAAAR